ncbi:hypothetical protein ACFQ1S_04750, partial [Kibdelosporangium lantanae]
PTGLLLAGDLAEAGHEVTVLERRPHTEANTTRAFACTCGPRNSWTAAASPTNWPPPVSRWTACCSTGSWST